MFEHADARCDLGAARVDEPVVMVHTSTPQLHSAPVDAQAAVRIELKCTDAERRGRLINNVSGMGDGRAHGVESWSVDVPQLRACPILRWRTTTVSPCAHGHGYRTTHEGRAIRGQQGRLDRDSGGLESRVDHGVDVVMAARSSHSCSAWRCSHVSRPQLSLAHESWARTSRRLGLLVSRASPASSPR